MISRFTNVVGSRLDTVWSPGSYRQTSISTQQETRQVTVLVPGSTTGDFKSPNPHAYRTHRSVQHNGLHASLSNNGLSGTISFGYLPRTPSHVSSMSEAFENNTFNTCLEKVFAEIRSEVDLSVAIAESGQTTRMLRSAIKLSKYIRSFHPRKWGDKWLEYQYGWKPLVNDIYGAAAAAQRVIPSLMTVRKTHTTSDEKKETIVGGNTQTMRRTTKTDRVLISADFNIRPSVLTGLGNFTSLNPASILWETLPYSFIVDWVYDVGGYIRNFETACLYSSAFTKGFVTKTSQLATLEREYGKWGSVQQSFEVSSQGFVITRNKNRSLLSSIPYPRPPKFKVDLGSERLLSTAALLSQHIGKR